MLWRHAGWAEPGPGGGVTASVANHAVICPQAHRPLSHRPLQPLNAYVVAFGAPAMHLGRDRPLLQHPRESQAGELAALVDVEDLWLAVAGQCLLHGIDAELALHREGQRPTG